MIYQVVQILYWLVLSIWVGGTIFLVLAAPVVFRAVRQREVRLPEVTSKALRDEHQTLLAGDIVAAMLGRLGQVQMVCMGVMLPLLIVSALFAAGTLQWVTLGEKSALYAVTVAVVLHDRWKRFPATIKARQRYIEHADEEELAQQAKAEFEALHRAGERAYQLVVFLLLLLVLVSANPEPRSSWIGQGGAPAGVESQEKP